MQAISAISSAADRPHKPVSPLALHFGPRRQAYQYRSTLAASSGLTLISNLMIKNINKQY
jgi:hypothetical protein